MTTTANLSQARAMSAYRAVCKEMGKTPADHFVEQGDGDPAWYNGPVLCRDYGGWYSTSRWAIIYEGDYEWVYRETVTAAANRPGVFAEPIAGYALGLYRP